jgi:peptidoglycan L-alanyl-D-glutamate endopeptidase CwlK
MPLFGAESKKQLATCDSDLQVVMNEAIKYINFSVIEGHRGQAAQEAAFAAGDTELHWPNGKHNKSPSLAVDIAPFPIDWSDSQRFVYFAGIIMGIAFKLKEEAKITHTLKWGGDWNNDTQVKDESFRDLGHFELLI